MRVISGLFKGRELRVPETEGGMRPTQDRVRESMFEILKMQIPGADVLELCAGSGALAIEALSRGANSAVLVERDSDCVKAIEENLAHVEVARHSKSAEVFSFDIFKALKRFQEQGKKFSIIIADPPYKDDYMLKKILIKLDRYDILKKPFLIMLEHTKKAPIPEKEGNIILIKQYNYGDTILSLYKKAGT